MTVKTILTTVIAAALIAACSAPDVILPGERVDVRDGMAGATPPQENIAQRISLPSPRVNAEWTHRNGGPTHQIAHPALGPSPTLVLAVPVGEGNSRRARITSDPVVMGGVIYTLDARATVTATAANGTPVWSRTVLTDRDDINSASGGGISAVGGRVYVSTAYGDVVALDAATGGEVWRQSVGAPAGSAPTVSGDLVYVVTRNSSGWAIDKNTGRVQWTIDGTPTTSSFAGGAGVAVNGTMAVFPFPSGEVLGAFPRGGLRRWSTVVSGQRLGSAGSTVSDISGDPVIVGDTIYVGNVSGRVVAMDINSGDRLWTAIEGAVGPVWPVGGSLFLINDIGNLVRLDASSGAAIWSVELPGFVESRERRQRTRYVHFGPVVAGGRVIVASSDGLLREFDPVSGALIGQVAIPGGAASNPVVAGGTLYVLNTDGQLLAFR